MFTSLAQFYNSEQWRNFRQQLIAERASKIDGILYCEYSGLPLLNGYDIIAHHKIPLTPENVNDFSISLDPENIMLVSHQAHNEIHKRFGHSAGRKVYYVFGPPCSGKTTFVKNVKGNSDIVCDMDNIWQCLTGGARYDKPTALKSNVFEVQRCIFDMIKKRVGNWERAYVIDGGASKTPRNNRINDLGAEPIFINASKEICLQRLASDKDRAKAHQKEWQQYIEKWFDEFQP